MSRAHVSVALAACNGTSFIDAQLASIASQTRSPDELVVCDDASDDDTRDRVRAFAASAAFPVQIEIHEHRLGITGNFASALTRTSGDVVLFADQDDVWAPEKIERLAGAFEHDPELGAVFSNGRCIDANGRPLGFDLWESLAFTPAERAQVDRGEAVDVFLRHVVSAGTTMAFAGRFRDLVLPFPPLRSAHDAWVAFLIACTSRVRAIDEPLIDYRLHGNNQIGIRKLGLLGQLRKAREQLEVDAFGYAVEFFEGARERLNSPACDDFIVAPGAFAGIDDKIEHARRRAAMPAGFFARLPDIAREVGNGGYRRFSLGLRSVAQDLFLR